MIEKFSPDIVVIATGGIPNVGDIEGAENVYSTWDMLGGHVAIGERVLMFDDQGADSAMGCSDFLAQGAKKLEVVTPERYLGIEAGAYNFPTYLTRLYEQGASISPDMRLRSVRRTGNGLTVGTAVGDGEAGGESGSTGLHGFVHDVHHAFDFL